MNGASGRLLYLLSQRAGFRWQLADLPNSVVNDGDH